MALALLAYSSGPNAPLGGEPEPDPQRRAAELARAVRTLKRLVEQERATIALALLGAGLLVALGLTLPELGSPETASGSGDFSTIGKGCRFDPIETLFISPVAWALAYANFRWAEWRYRTARLAGSLWQLLQSTGPELALTAVQRSDDPQIAAALSRAIERYRDDVPLGPALAASGIWRGTERQALASARRDADVFGPLAACASAKRDGAVRQLLLGSGAIAASVVVLVVLQLVNLPPLH